VEVSTKSFAQIVSKCCPTRGRWGEEEKVFSQGKWEEEEESERKSVRKS